jgi:benzoylsuccinyl-CoA thiolase BbsA subunit
MGGKREGDESAAFFHPDLVEIPSDGAKPYLKGYRCKKCGQLDFPKLSPCPNCWHDQFEVVPLSRVGKLYAVTHISVGQAGLPTPYAFGYIDLPENLRIFAQVEGEPGSLKCDDEVEMFIGTIRTNSDGLPVQSYKFRKAGRDRQ